MSEVLLCEHCMTGFVVIAKLLEAQALTNKLGGLSQMRQALDVLEQLSQLK